jgi:hypothetical protein
VLGTNLKFLELSWNQFSGPIPSEVTAHASGRTRIGEQSTHRLDPARPRQSDQIVLDELVRSFAGSSRDTAYSDLHGLRLQVDVVEGKGSIVPFVIVTDNGSGDSIVRLE